jgi:hypothetical protein
MKPNYFRHFSALISAKVVKESVLAFREQMLHLLEFDAEFIPDGRDNMLKRHRHLIR